MSVTPTEDELIVALDFEGVYQSASRFKEQYQTRPPSGVHSIERSAQEDTLLVLFNTAISNLVGRSFTYLTHPAHTVPRFYSATTLRSREILQVGFSLTRCYPDMQ